MTDDHVEETGWTHVITGGPWPERIGLRCRLVSDPRTGIYPFDSRQHEEVVVLVENDPHDGSWLDAARGWTCRIGRTDLSREAPDV